MFTRLQQKWKVGAGQLILILCTFALGGSATGFVAKKIMNGLAVEADWLWAVIYIVLVTLLWPLSVLLVSIPFGQFRFFSRYIRKMGAKLGLARASSDELPPREPLHLAIFASGAGSNARAIVEHFRQHPVIRISLLVSNRPEAGLEALSREAGIPLLAIDKERFIQGDGYIHELIEKKTDWLILAGFLWKVPASLVQAYRDRILNIHPALLPKFGGAGMYGSHVHRAVLTAGEKETGITIHRVDEVYDHGEPVFQAQCPVLEGDTVESLSQRVQELEHRHYPVLIEKMVTG
jgi:formyltetrahydrofolate-dependent phosphoribosylglycinamide formyltransferase